jgi:hypothetical protein
MNSVIVEKEDLISAAVQEMLPAPIILDIGCGIRPQQFIVPMVHICVEPFKQYVHVLQQKISGEVDRDYVIINTEWENAIKLIPEKSVDSIFIIDVIEHLDKNEAIILLKNTEKLARKQIILFTPLGFLPQEHPDGKDAWGLDGGDWQNHKSGWEPKDFDKSWKIIISKDFHDKNSFGIPHTTPFGAMWAIKTMKDGNTSVNKQKLLQSEIKKITLSIKNIYVIRIGIFFFRLLYLAKSVLLNIFLFIKKLLLICLI